MKIMEIKKRGNDDNENDAEIKRVFLKHKLCKFN